MSPLRNEGPSDRGPRRRMFISATAWTTFGLFAGLINPPISAEESHASSVGTRVGYAALDLSDGANRWMVSRLSHTIPLGARNLQLVYGNFAPGPHDFEADGPNPIVVAAAVEFPEGNVYPVRFAGRSDIRLLPGQMAISDPLSVILPPGGRCFTRTRVIADTPPYKWPLVRSANPLVGDWSATGLDINRVSDAPEARREPKCFGPYNMIGVPQRPGNAVVILGDSVVCGEPGPGDQHGDRGYIERALATNMPWCNFAVPGESVAAFIRQSTKRRAMIGHNFTKVVSALGIADVRNGNEELIKQNMHSLWKLLGDQGLAVFQTTITTHTNSIDHWTSVGGQSVANPNFGPGGVYHRINDWIRSGPPPLRGYFDPVPAVETGIDSGIWLAPENQPLTLDGPHLDRLGAMMAEKAISLPRLQSQ